MYKITRSHERAVYILALIFLPGTFIHEMSHFLVALFLLVPVGELRLIPEVKENGVRLGSVKVAKTDILRESLIGIAPFVIGTSVIFGVVSYAISSNLISNPYFVAFVLYLIFQVTHTMFSSKEDLTSVLELSVLLVIILLLMLVFDVTGPFELLASAIEQNREIIERISLYVFIPIGLEFLLILLFQSPFKFWIR